MMGGCHRPLGCETPSECVCGLFVDSVTEDALAAHKAEKEAAYQEAMVKAVTKPAPGLNLSGDSASRKAVPVASGVLDYFPAALLEIAKVSKAGNDKHNPGQPLHHARGKSTDHADALLRHLIDRGSVDEETGMRHSAEMAWRALALLQQELEDEGLAPLARGAKL